MVRVLRCGLAVVALCPGAAVGQDTVPDPSGAAHVLALEGAGLWQGLDDAMASPLRYRGAAGAMAAAYRGAAGSWRWGVHGAWARTRLASSLDDGLGGYEEAAWVFADVRVTRRVHTWERVTFRAGTGLAGEVGTRRHQYTETDWLSFRNGVVALQAVLEAEAALGRAGRLAGTLALPVAGLAVRKEYAGVVGRPPRVMFGFAPSLILVSHGLEYRVDLVGPLTARASVNGTWVRHDDPAELASVSQRIGLALEWALGG